MVQLRDASWGELDGVSVGKACGVSGAPTLRKTKALKQMTNSHAKRPMSRNEMVKKNSEKKSEG